MTTVQLRILDWALQLLGYLVMEAGVKDEDVVKVAEHLALAVKRRQPRHK